MMLRVPIFIFNVVENSECDAGCIRDGGRTKPKGRITEGNCVLDSGGRYTIWTRRPGSIFWSPDTHRPRKTRAGHRGVLRSDRRSSSKGERRWKLRSDYEAGLRL